MRFSLSTFQPLPTRVKLVKVVCGQQESAGVRSGITLLRRTGALFGQSAPAAEAEVWLPE
jgi:hypothetical protein